METGVAALSLQRSPDHAFTDEGTQKQVAGMPCGIATFLRRWLFWHRRVLVSVSQYLGQVALYLMSRTAEQGRASGTLAGDVSGDFAERKVVAGKTEGSRSV